MSDLLPESVPETAEPQALPTPAVSTPSEARPSATTDADALVSRLKEALLPELKTYIDRSSQSVKDRRIVGLEKRIEELAAAKTVLDAHGGDVTKAARELAVDEILGRGESQTNLGKVGEDWETGVREILSEAEKSAGVKIPLDDPELRSAIVGPDGKPRVFPNWAAAYAAVNRVVLRRARGIPAAMVAGEVYGLPATTQTTDELANQLRELIYSNAPAAKVSEARAKLTEAMARK